MPRMHHAAIQRKKCSCKSKNVIGTFKLKGETNFETKCLGTFKNEKGVKFDRWQVACSNLNERADFVPKVWPFKDGSGNSIVHVKQPPSDKTCKKGLAKIFKRNRVIRCEHDESKLTGCQCGEFKDGISKSMNTAKQEKLALTATCANTESAESEIETWKLHCDSNGNGVIDNDEEAKTVSVNTKANEFYCKVKKTISEGLKCSKPAGATCLCDDFWDHFDYEVDFKKEHKKGIKIVTECVSGTEKDGKECGISMVKKLKHDNEKERCLSKLKSDIKTFVKENNIAKFC
ncbi:Oidioi.mRNA.OKI2018_I69.PAR.g10145.t1.cds [Oikopleura dioica]|uniref:Oidioi.mRNA.OKI2018_I69.PAR.g10145.t1.cds n=1 Tax=Oikopleura dioica TaxID=34765 RepID=A0ABN7RT39_OIKDI|nr:Oidioi.mRNA.OKI2018_I69.PAR.g10145.t1.cds [Oikopleura dioica]